MRKWAHRQQHEKVELQSGEAEKKKNGLGWAGLIFSSHTVTGPAPGSQSPLLISGHHIGQKFVWGENRTSRHSLLFFHIHNYLKMQLLLPTAGQAEKCKLEALQSVLSGWGKTVKTGIE